MGRGRDANGERGRPATGGVARADVAAAMLRAVEERLWIGESPAVTGA